MNSDSTQMSKLLTHSNTKVSQVKDMSQIKLGEGVYFDLCVVKLRLNVALLFYTLNGLRQVFRQLIFSSVKSYISIMKLK